VSKSQGGETIEVMAPYSKAPTGPLLRSEVPLTRRLIDAF
jgi:hypothetical protein